MVWSSLLVGGFRGCTWTARDQTIVGVFGELVPQRPSVALLANVVEPRWRSERIPLHEVVRAADNRPESSSESS